MDCGRRDGRELREKYDLVAVYVTGYLPKVHSFEDISADKVSLLKVIPAQLKLVHWDSTLVGSLLFPIYLR